MRPFAFIRRMYSRESTPARPLSRYSWIRTLFNHSTRTQRRSTRLQLEVFEDRIVPTATSLLYNFSDDGGVLSSGLNRTLTIGQSLFFDVNVARTTDGTTASPAAPTPTGTVTFTLTDVSTSANYTIGTIALTTASTGVGQAQLLTSLLPTTPDVYDLSLAYSGDSNYTTASASDVAAFTLQSPPTGAPADLAPDALGGSSPVQAPAGDGVAADVGVSEAGVVYATGAVVVSRTDLASYGFGTQWGQSWDWTNAAGYVDGLSGGGSVAGGGGTQTQAPHLAQINGDSGIAVVANGANADFFDLYGGAYHARFGLDATLTHDTGANEYVLTVNGSTFTFNDFSGGDTTAAAGSLLSVADAYGDMTTVESWNSAGAPLVVQQTSGSGSTEITQQFVSTYVSSGVDAGLLASVTEQREVGTGGFSTVEAASYTYYGSGDANGRAGELETAVVEDAASNLMSAAYYRYYTTGLVTASHGSLRMAFNTQGYEQLIATYSTTDFDSLTNAQVMPYASAAYEYQVGGAAVVVGLAGYGSGTPSYAVGSAFSYSYGSNTTSETGLLDPNVWTTKTIEQLPGLVDGEGTNENIVYTNAFGQVILSVYQDYATGDQWDTFYRYNSNDQLVLEASPSAVTGFSESYPDLVNWSGSGATDLSSSSGLITTYTYGSSTTATSSTSGNVAGYLEETAIQQGTGGTSVPQESYTYLSNTAGGATVYKVATDTVYRNSDGTGTETTSYAYSYYSGTNAVYSITTTLPTITTGQNGSGSANTTETVYSTIGQPTWTKDADGYIDYTQYDPATSAVVEQIQDVNTSISSDFTGLPSGWSTISGAGLNLVTSDQVDSLGRVTEETHPNGRPDYFVYDDADQEMREYDGWNSTTDTATGPTKVTIDDWAGGFTDTLTMTATPAVSSGVPTGTESIADVQSLTRTFWGIAGQTLETDQYFNLGGLSYSSGTLGTSGVNYYATLDGYDSDGNQNVTVSPEGTISLTVYDGQHRVVSQWVGTDDSNTSSNNMVETESYQYDGGGVGDGDLTQTVQYPGGSAANRVTDYWYNWRDQKVAEKDGVSSSESDGVNRPLTVWTNDNLGKTTETQVYSGNGVTPSISAGVLSLPSGTSSDLQAETVTSYDNQGKVYETQEYSVNPTTGAVSSTALTTNNYYDPNGNLIATSAPGGLWTKSAYDGAGRQVMQYQTDGGSGTTYADAGSLSGDIVLSQTQTVYDGDSNVIESITRDRFNTDSSTSYGALGTPSSGVGARVYYSASYYDLADRLIDSVDVGTNGGSAWTRPTSVSSVPSSALVTSQSYAADAVQTVQLTGSPTGGTFTLTFGGDTTSAIAYNASNATVQSDLAALADIGSGNVFVSTALGGGWEIRFTGSLAGSDQNQMTASSSLTGGTSPGVSINTLSLGGDAGNVVDVVDPDGIDSRTYSDPLGRAVQTIQDFTNGVVSDSSNKTTDYTYNAAGMTSLTAELGSGAGETTEWVYGVTTGGGSAIDSNDIVGVTEQPNPSTGAPDSGLSTTVTVDALGDTLTSTDADGTTHTYTYDVLSQETADAVTTLGSGIDGSVLLIGTSYTTLGDPETITSYSLTGDPGAIVNQVENVYNGLDQLIQQYQSASGMVNTSTTPSVQYNYTDLASGNNSRLTAIVYPDGYTVDYNYSTGLNSNISRLSSLSDDTGTLESYLYLGLDTVVEMDHPESGVNLTYISTSSGTGSAGDQYTGLDEFGRVIEQNWYDPTTSSSIVDLQYGYDKDGNVLYRQDNVNSAMSELYGYDNLSQLTSFERGTLNSTDTAITGTPSVSETWGYDALGNHLTDTTNGTTVTSTFNADNQITAMSGSTTPAYDADGNMTTDQAGLTYKYNAWGKLVDVYSGSTLEESYSYDGLGNRMTNTVGSTTTDLYNSTASSGQVLEESVGGVYTTRYVWSPAYVNEMISRDTDTSGTGLTATGSSFTRLWAIQDANYNVVALVNSSGDVVERYAYDPFGAVTYLTGSYGSRSASSYGWVFLFQGGRFDGVTGDTHFGARNVDPQTGTWTSEDPLGFGGGNLVLSQFESNSSGTNFDPTGFADNTLPRSQWKPWMRNLEGNESGRPGGSVGGGSIIKRIKYINVDKNHPGGRHYDVIYEEDTGVERKQRFKWDGTPFTEEENEEITKKSKNRLVITDPIPGNGLDWLRNPRPDPFAPFFPNPNGRLFRPIPSLPGSNGSNPMPSTAPIENPFPYTPSSPPYQFPWPSWGDNPSVPPIPFFPVLPGRPLPLPSRPPGGLFPPPRFGLPLLPLYLPDLNWDGIV